MLRDVTTPGRGGTRTTRAFATPIAEVFDYAAESFGEAELVFPTERCTYAELGARVDHLARALVGLGIGANDKVGMLLVPCIDYYALMGAVAKVGAISVPINARFKSRELSYVISDGDMKTILVSPPLTPETDYLGMLNQALPALADQVTGELDAAAAPELRSVVLMGPGQAAGCRTRAEFDALADGVDLAEIDRRQDRVRIRDIAMIIYTSGTESNPKGCLLSHEALIRNAINIGHARFELTPADRMWNPLPLFHNGGIVLFFACLATGAGYVHPGFFEPGVALDQLEQERVTVSHATFETIWLAVLGHPRFEQADLSSLRAVMNVGVPERLRAMALKLPQAKPFSAFGATESSSYLSLSRPDEEVEYCFTTGGHPMPGMEVRVVDPETGEDLPAESEGEVLYRGYSLFEGYYKAPDLNAECFDADGWFHSKDVGVLDPDGRLTFRSRLKDMLKVGGENVAAAEIESLIAEHPAVEIVQVVGVRDEKYVEVATAFIQLKSGATCTEDEIINSCIGQIATFKVPRYVRFIEEWPMSGTKIRKVELRQTIAAELDAAGITKAPSIKSKAVS
jgi:fatty-acyl-CoA synthase